MAHYAAFELITDCPKCGNPVPLNGPAQMVQCMSCQNDFQLSATFWKNVLEDWHESSTGKCFTEGFEVTVKSGPESPECRECQTPLPVHSAPSGVESSIRCTNCAVAYPTSPAPDWLKSVLPHSGLMIGAESPGDDSAGVALEINQESPQLVAMACPKCGGSLEISVSTDRVHGCSFCNTDVFVPDAIWRRLHPVKEVETWWLAFDEVEQPQVEASEPDIFFPEPNPAAAPVLRACPKCGGSLEISVSTDRVHGCSFCNTDVFVPDAIWRRLHPVKEVETWWLAFDEVEQPQVEASEPDIFFPEPNPAAAPVLSTYKPKKKKFLVGLSSVLGFLGIGAAVVFFWFFMASSAEGEFTSKGDALGDFTMTINDCASGDRQNFFGVMLRDENNKNQGMKVMRDPRDGDIVMVVIPSSCTSSGKCSMLIINSKSKCKTFAVTLEQQNKTTNEVTHIEGSVDLDCDLKAYDPKTKKARIGHIEGQAKFSDCH